MQTDKYGDASFYIVKEYEGRKPQVYYSRDTFERSGKSLKCKVYVSNIPERMSAELVRYAASAHARVVTMKVNQSRVSSGHYSVVLTLIAVDSDALSESIDAVSELYLFEKERNRTTHVEVRSYDPTPYQARQKRNTLAPHAFKASEEVKIFTKKGNKGDEEPDYEKEKEGTSLS